MCSLITAFIRSYPCSCQGIVVWTIAICTHFCIVNGNIRRAATIVCSCHHNGIRYSITIDRCILRQVFYKDRLGRILYGYNLSINRFIAGFIGGSPCSGQGIIVSTIAIGANLIIYNRYICCRTTIISCCQHNCIRNSITIDRRVLRKILYKDRLGRILHRNNLNTCHCIISFIDNGEGSGYYIVIIIGLITDHIIMSRCRCAARAHHDRITGSNNIC